MRYVESQLFFWYLWAWWMIYCTSGPITIQPGHKLLPANAQWSNELFASCNPVSDGDYSLFNLFKCHIHHFRDCLLHLWSMLRWTLAQTYRWKFFWMLSSGCYTSTSNKDSNGLWHQGLYLSTCFFIATNIFPHFISQGTLINDWLASCCGPCSLLQMKKELDRQGVPDPDAK